ncbi:SurA-like protein [Natranaerovirga hydrolytica]|uniref:SurA-like protein n=1 Tax=Natranaerovirga hydrolytica TaxID=680378 RepID=A0A4R1N0K4_9FIRM|nr:SurA N-terminal domain-containing protein [Natranaerovirga hydrolytica]TCK98440.1 SurA-like protein [Natranaerovirga hydrolytica]
MKKTKFNVFIITILCILVWGSINLMGHLNDEIIIATVNGEPIEKHTIDNMKETYEINGSSISEKELLDRVIEHKVLEQVARKMQIEVSDDVVDDYIKEAKIVIQEDEEIYDFHTSYLQEWDISDDAYWEMMWEDYKTLLSLGELRKEVLSNESILMNGPMSSELRKEKEVIWNDFVRNEMEKANIEYID